MTQALDTDTDDLLADVDQGVAIVTMNRPDRRNALSPAMLDALARVLRDLELNDEVGCVVLTGAGGAFCSGGDVKAMAQGDGAEVQFDARVQRQRINQRETAGRLHWMPKPTIAMIGGPVAGAGLSLALACDLRYASRSAVFTTAFAGVALAGDYGGTWFLPRLVGSARARELYFLPERSSAEDVAQLGIVNAVFDPDELESEVLTRAQRIAGGPRVTYAYMKENLNRAETGELGECLDMEAAHHLRTALTEDHREAAKAFAEKRAPRFRGR